MLLWALFVLAHSVDLAEDEGVLTLTDATLLLAEMRYMWLFLHFHAPLCSLCRNVTSDMRRSADIVRREFPAFRMGELDISTETVTARRFGVVGVPTLMFLEKNETRSYTGDLTAKGIEAWVLSLLRTDLPLLSSPEELSEFRQASNFSAVLYAAEDSPQISLLREVQVAYAPVAVCPASPAYSSQAPILVLSNNIDNHDFHFTGPWETTAVSAFLSKWTVRLSMRWDEAAADYIFRRGNPLLFLFRHEGFAVTYEKIVSVVSKSARIPIVAMDPTYGLYTIFAEMLGVEKIRMPAAMIVHLEGNRLIKYDLRDAPVNPTTIAAFIDAFESKSAAVFYKSEVQNRISVDISSQKGKGSTVGLMEVTGARFREILRKPGQTVVLLLTQTDGDETAEAAVAAIAGEFRSRPDVLFVKVNGSKNDVEDFDGARFPAVIVYPTPDKRPRKFPGKVEKAAVLSFLSSLIFDSKTGSKVYVAYVCRNEATIPFFSVEPARTQPGFAQSTCSVRLSAPVRPAAGSGDSGASCQTWLADI